jgi:hypothetical protein
MGSSVKRVFGTLTATDGAAWHVDLKVTTVLLLGEHGFEEEKIGKVELDSRGVPDGEYMLEYFFSDYHREQVRLTKGVLTAA